MEDIKDNEKEIIMTKNQVTKVETEIFNCPYCNGILDEAGYCPCETEEKDDNR